MFIKVKATPKAKKEKIEKTGDFSFAISVKEPSERNLANTRIRELLALELNVPIGKVRIVSGHTSPSKMFKVE